jgi:hypothetical protein
MAQKQIVPRDLIYEANNVTYDEQDKCDGIKCKNYEVCGTVLPNWWWDCKNQYVCSGCDMTFGTWSSEGVHRTGKGELGFADNIECPVCLEVNRGVTYPNCEHHICIKCFKRCFYGDANIEPEPEFPYPIEVQDEWENDRDNPRWDIEYPLIRHWDIADQAWLDNQEIRYAKEEHLRQCPLCRK